jgi:hypothetical protein
MILRVQVGSGMHGTSLTGQDDRDEMGLCLEPAQYVTGLARVPAGMASTVSALAARSWSTPTLLRRGRSTRHQRANDDFAKAPELELHIL